MQALHFLLQLGECHLTVQTQRTAPFPYRYIVAKDKGKGDGCRNPLGETKGEKLLDDLLYWEYWVINPITKEAMPMPKKYIIEMVCDWRSF
ncbi:DUF5662 family protein [Brevibacillus sp. 179-C 9.1 HS]|uniref:DUF5662 family protein n=1 Tax=unclassified Brevibacillus TaxID=2684853 RepID=UPI0039A3F73A